MLVHVVYRHHTAVEMALLWKGYTPVYIRPLQESPAARHVRYQNEHAVVASEVTPITSWYTYIGSFLQNTEGHRRVVAPATRTIEILPLGP